MTCDLSKTEVSRSTSQLCLPHVKMLGKKKMLGKLGEDVQLSAYLQATARQSDKTQGLLQQDPLITERLKTR